MTGAALRDILGDSRDAKCCTLQNRSQNGTSKVSEAAGAR